MVTSPRNKYDVDIVVIAPIRFLDGESEPDLLHRFTKGVQAKPLRQIFSSSDISNVLNEIAAPRITGYESGLRP
jgi:hypothetical protein